MVVIRLSRAGAKNRPFYSIVVTDRRKRGGDYIECIGYFNPIARGTQPRLHLEMTKLEHWQGQGAQLSDRVRALVKEHNKNTPKVA